MKTKNIIIILAALALCCFAASCTKQNDNDSQVEEKVASLLELTATLGEEQAALKVYVAALGADFEKYAAEVDSLLKVLDKRLDAAEAVIPTLAGMSYVESTFATLEVVDSLSKVAAAIAVKVQSDSTALAGSIKSKTEASEKKIMDLFGSYYTSAEIDEKIKVLSDRLDTLFSDMDTAVFKHIADLKIDVKSLGENSKELSKKLEEDVAALKDRDTVFLNQIDSLDEVYADILGSLAKMVSADSARIEDLRARVGKLEGRVQSVRVVPDYSDGKVDMMNAATGIKFDVRPVSAAKALVEKKLISAFSFQIIEALASTKAGIYTDIKVDSVKMSGEDSLLVLFVDGTEMPQVFFDTTKLYNARLRIHDGGSDCSSSYFALNPPPKYPEASDQPCIKIAGTWWAPVNCGYGYHLGTSGDSILYSYGLLYQWGRKDGGGYKGDSPYNVEKMQEYTTGQTANPDSSKFYGGAQGAWYSGTDPLWGITGRSSYDPCPIGWRVPTKDELTALRGGHTTGALQDGTGVHSGMKGKWFDGSTAAEPISGVFLPAAGYRTSNGGAKDRTSEGRYWLSLRTDSGNNLASFVFLKKDYVNITNTGRSNGNSVRCVYCGK